MLAAQECDTNHQHAFVITFEITIKLYHFINYSVYFILPPLMAKVYSEKKKQNIDFKT